MLIKCDHINSSRGGCVSDEIQPPSEGYFMTIRQKTLIGRNAPNHRISIIFFATLFLAVQLLGQLHVHEDLNPSEAPPECDLCQYSGMSIVPVDVVKTLLLFSLPEVIHLSSAKSSLSPANFSPVQVRAPPMPNEFMNN